MADFITASTACKYKKIDSRRIGIGMLYCVTELYEECKLCGEPQSITIVHSVAHSLKGIIHEPQPIIMLTITYSDCRV